MADNLFYAQDNANRQDLLLKERSPNVKRSVFPYGIQKVLKFNEGYIVPVDLIPVIPGDSLDIDFILNIFSNNPLVERMFSGMQVFVHAFYQSNDNEWKGWRNYATEGRRGNISLSLPELDVTGTQGLENRPNLLVNGQHIQYKNSTLRCRFDNVGSLASYLADLATTTNRNVPDYDFENNFKINNVIVNDISEIEGYGIGPSSQKTRSFSVQTDLDSGLTSLLDGVAVESTQNHLRLNAIPFATYQRIYRDFYSPKNLFNNNVYWFPDDEDDFCLPYALAPNRLLVSLSSNRYFRGEYSLVPNNYSGDVPTASVPAGDSPVLAALRCRQFDGDIFTTGLPFLERGGQTELFMQLMSAFQAASPYERYGVPEGVEKTVEIEGSGLQQLALNGYYPSSFGTPDSGVGRVKSPVALGSGIYTHNLGIFQTMNQLRELAVMTLWSERNARTDGSYNDLIRAHYGITPRTLDRSARYLGGSRLRINFDSVTQMSETENTPLGQKAATAYASGMGHIGHQEFTDFGFIHIYMSMIPDTYYNQGLLPWLDHRAVGSDLPYPEFTSLPRGVVPASRVFYDGRTADVDLFSYQERFLDYKYRQSRLSGGMLDFTDLSTRAMTFSRVFNKAPSFNSEFVTASPYNLRDDMYTVPKDFHYIAQFADSVRLVRCLPFVNEEANLANIA